MLPRHPVRLKLAVVLATVVFVGCVSSDERSFPDIPLAAAQYDPMDHFPPSSDADGQSATELAEIRSLLRDRQFSPALEELDRQISAQRGSEPPSLALPQLLVLRGMTRFKLHNPKGALADYDEAISLDGAYWPAYFHRWQCQLELGDRPAASADREAGRKLAPEKFDRDYDPHPAGMI